MRRQYQLTLAVTRPVLSVVMALVVFAFGVLSASTDLHHALHHDADSHSGHCAVCSFAKSQVAAADVPLVVCRPVVLASVAAIPAVSSIPQNPSLLLPPGRAPPIPAVVF